jgi:hypothetical protein
MSVTMASDSMSSAILTVAVPDARSRPGDPTRTTSDGNPVRTSNGPATAPQEPPVPDRSDLPDVLPPMPPPPDPPGTIFAAAVLAGALSPKPETPQEIFLRLGSAWSPQDSGLRLADRTA